MKNYQEIQEQIKQLQVEAEKARLAEVSSVISDIKAKIKEYNLTPADLGFKGMAKSSKPSVLSEPKYRDPKTGKTWTGRGKPPQWIVEAYRAKKADSFLISVQQEKAAAKEAAKTAAKPDSKKATAPKKTAAKKPAPKKKAPSTESNQVDATPPNTQE